MLNIYNLGGYDIFLMKYGSTGSVLWTSLQGTSGDEKAFDVAVSVDGFIYVTGYTGGSLNTQPFQGIRQCSYYINLLISLLFRYW